MFYLCTVLSVELFMGSWFYQVLKVFPFPPPLHVRLVFLLDFFPFTLSLFSGSDTYFSSRDFFFFLISVNKMKSGFHGLAKSNHCPNKSCQLSPL